MKVKIILILFAAITVIITACSTYENSPAIVNIDLGLNREAASLKSPYRAAAPSDLAGDITLTVTGSGMNDITETIPSDTGLLSITVPSGTARKFEVRAVARESAGDYTGYNGQQTVNLDPASITDLTITMQAVSFSRLRSNSNENLYPTSIAVDQDTDSVYISGYGDPGGYYWYTEKRNINSGELETAWDNG